MRITRVPWGEMAMAALALPAYLSPILLLPVPPEAHIPPAVVRLAMICYYPRLWAAAATLAAALFIFRGGAGRARKVMAAVIALGAWIPAQRTATILAGWERF